MEKNYEEKKSSSSEIIPSQIEVFVRLRPQAGGIADIPQDNPDIKEAVHVLKSVDAEKRKLFFKHREKGHDTKQFGYFKEILTDDMNQEAVYEKMMPFYLEKFQEGFNVNFLAYGQTGSGKTHTVLAPKGNFSKGCSINENHGLFPRLADAVFDIASSKNAILTMQLCENGIPKDSKKMYPIIQDLITDKTIKIHPKTNELYGIHEYVVSSKDQLMELCAMVEKKRSTASHAMNLTSSRSHMMIELKMYEKQGDEVHVNCFKCMDMAGSERLAKTGHASGSIEEMQGIIINYNLTQFARILCNLKNQKVITGGQPLPTGCSWKLIELAQMMKSSFNGTSFTFFIICVSQADNNSGETYSSLQFGKDAHGLKMKIKKPPMINIKKALTKVEKEIKTLQGDIDKAPNEATKTRLENDMGILKERLEVFTTIANK